MSNDIFAEVSKDAIRENQIRIHALLPVVTSGVFFVFLHICRKILELFLEKAIKLFTFLSLTIIFINYWTRLTHVVKTASLNNIRN
jgi:hypothetical protein